MDGLFSMHRLVFQMDRRMRKMAKILKDHTFSYQVNSSSFICVENDKSVRSFADPGKKICARITKEEEEKHFLIEQSAMLNSLPEKERSLLCDFFIDHRSKTALSKKFRIKDVNGALYFALLDLAVVDPTVPFTAKERKIFEEKCQAHERSLDQRLEKIMSEVNELKEKLKQGLYHQELKKLPPISKEHPNDYFFHARSGRNPRDYKKRSMLAFALYCIQHPQTSRLLVDRFLSRADFGQNFMKKVKYLIHEEVNRE